MLNQAQIIGHLGKDPDIRYTADGTAIANFSVATSEKWKDKVTGEQKEATEWHKVVFYGKSAEFIQNYIVKGTLVYVSGKLQTRKWQDKEGIERYTTEIKGDDIKILKSDRAGHAADTAPVPTARRQPAPPTAQHSIPDDDIPF